MQPGEPEAILADPVPAEDLVAPVAAQEDLGPLAGLLEAVKSIPQPQVEQKVDLLMVSLVKAVILVVIVSAIGFWDLRSALLMATQGPQSDGKWAEGLLAEINKRLAK